MPVVTLPAEIAPATVNVAVTLTPAVVDPTPASNELTYAWVVKDPNNLEVFSGTTATATFTPALVGNYSVQLTVTDVSGAGSFMTLRTMTVLPTPTILIDNSAITVDEGGQKTVQVSLNRAPQVPLAVSISRTSGDSDLSAGAATLTFSSANWNIWQTMTLSAAADADAIQGTATFMLSAAGWTSAVVTATEADAQRKLLVSLSQLTLTEQGSASLTVQLAGPPETPVVVTIDLSGTGLSLTTPATLEFTPANWNTPQTLTVHSAGDADAVDGSGSLTLTASGWRSATVPVTVADVDRRTLVSGSLDLVEGTTGMYQVTLAGVPASPVTVTVALDNTSDLTLSGSTTLTFDSMNWNVAQSVTIQTVSDSNAAPGSGTLKFSALGYSESSLSINVTDDDRAIVAELAENRILEGDTLTYAIRLAGQPAAPVTVTTTSSGDADVRLLSGGTLIFSPENWQQPQFITLAADADVDAAEGLVTLTSTAATWTPAVLSIREIDVDRQFVVTPDPLAGPLTIAEGGTQTFQVKLLAQPGADETVTIPVQWLSGDRDVVVDGTATLTFSSSNWNQPQTVLLRALSDSNVTSDATSFSLSADGWKSTTVNVLEQDNGQWWELADTTVTVAEAGNATFGLRLREAPESPVRITAELLAGGDASVTLTGNVELFFDSTNWNVFQNVILQAEEDADVLDGTATLRFSRTDLGPVQVSVHILDNDAVILVTPSSLGVPEGGVATWKVRLGGAPTGTVTITAVLSGDSSFSLPQNATFTFDATNWQTEREFQISAAQDDDLQVGFGNLTLSAPGWQSASVLLQEFDDERKILVSGINDGQLSVAEGGTGSVGVSLAAQPGSPVTVTLNLRSGDSDITLTSGNTLVFDAANWNVPQQVTLAADQDADSVDGARVLELNGDAADGSWSLTNVTILEQDNDAAAILVEAASELTTSEAGGTASFTVALATQPAGTVVVPIRSGRPEEGALSATSLFFDATNWNVPQTVTIRGVDDHIADGTQSLQITLGPASGGSLENTSARRPLL